MPSAQIRALEFLARQNEARPESSSATLRASLEDGKESTFKVATPDQPALALEAEGFSFGMPTLFVRRLDEETVAEAAQAMAAEMGGYWLRYYNTPGEPAAAPAKPAKKKPAKKGKAK